jgi:hypothetical protein
LLIYLLLFGRDIGDNIISICVVEYLLALFVIFGCTGAPVGCGTLSDIILAVVDYLANLYQYEFASTILFLVNEEVLEF